MSYCLALQTAVEEPWKVRRAPHLRRLKAWDMVLPRFTRAASRYVITYQELARLTQGMNLRTFLSRRNQACLWTFLAGRL